MFDKMKQLMEMKKHAERIKRELDSLDVEYADNKGIKIVLNGSQEFKSIEIKDELLNAALKEKFEADLIRCLNAAVKKSQAVAAQKMKDVLPGFPGI